MKCIIYGIMAGIASVVLCGCGASAKPADPNAAQKALVAALDAWKAGKQPTEVGDIVVQDFDWMNGATLVDYSVLGEAEVEGLNAFFSVRLKVKPKGKSEESKDVRYMIGTNPKTTVFREIRL